MGFYEIMQGLSSKGIAWSDNC